MLKILEPVMTIVDSLAQIIGVMGAFGSMSTGINPYALCILGVAISCFPHISATPFESPVNTGYFFKFGCCKFKNHVYTQVKESL